MLKLISQLCESNCLVVQAVDIGLEGIKGKIATPEKGNNHQEYFLIIDCVSADEDLIDRLLGQYSEKLMDDLSTLDSTDESFRKNCTIIFCCETGLVSPKDLLKLEEDPYFFKKNVITYSRSELVALREKINNQFSNQHLNELLMGDGGESFESFKKNAPGDNDYYPLLVKIITKLPFVHYMPQSNDLDSLDAFVRNGLDNSELMLFDSICSTGGSFNDDFIDSMLPQGDVNE